MGNNGKIWFWQATWMTYPPIFCPLWIAKWANIPPKWAKWAISPKKEQNPRGWGICSLYSYINFGHFFVICPSPQNGGIVKESKVSHALDRVRFCILSTKRRSGSNEVGLAGLEWCDVFDPEYRRSTWKEWFTDVTSLVVDKWTSPCPW